MTDVNTTRIASLAQIEKANEKINHSIYNHMRNNATNKRRVPFLLEGAQAAGKEQCKNKEEGLINVINHHRHMSERV